MDDLQRQIAALEATIAHQERDIAQLEAECAELKDALADFEARYERIVKPVETRLRAVRDAVAKMRDLHFKRSLGAKETLESLWRGGAKRRPDVEPPPVDAGDEDDALPSAQRPAGQSIKALYRKLARQYHPDLAATPEDRQRRNALMALINKAYVEADIDALRGLDEAAPDPRYDDVHVPLLQLKLRRLQRQHRDLADRLDDLRALRTDLRYGTTMELNLQAKQAQARGEDLLAQIADDLEREYWEMMAVLDDLRQTME